jgi:transcriptional regulator with XRE-family HTH domain
VPLAPEEVGRRIREARLAHGWTHEELARRVGVNWRTVQRWQKGQLPRLGTLVRLAETLGLPRSYFVEEEDLGAVLDELRAGLQALAERVEDLSGALASLERARPETARARAPQRRGSAR